MDIKLFIRNQKNLSFLNKAYHEYEKLFPDPFVNQKFMCEIVRMMDCVEERSKHKIKIDMFHSTLRRKSEYNISLGFFSVGELKELCGFIKLILLTEQRFLAQKDARGIKCCRTVGSFEYRIEYYFLFGRGSHIISVEINWAESIIEADRANGKMRFMEEPFSLGEFTMEEIKKLEDFLNELLW